MKSLIIAAASIAAFQTLALEYHWRGGEPGTVPDGEGVANLSGDWHTADNWTDASGSPIGGYPHQAGDVAVFHGMAHGGYARIDAADSIEIDEIRFAEGMTTVACAANAHVAVGRMTFGEKATFSYVSSDYDSFTSPTDFTIGNRDELLIKDADGNYGAFKGGTCANNWAAANIGNRMSISIDADGKLITKQGKFELMNVDLYGDTVHEDLFGVFFGNWGDFRGINYNNGGAWKYTIPGGLLGSVNAISHVGRPSDGKQGSICTLGADLYCLPNNNGTDGSIVYFRSLVDAPAFVQSGYGTTVLFDDHSSETNDYYVTSGTLRLGGDVCNGSADNVEQWPCKFGSGDIHVAWSGTLEFGCNDVMPKKLPGCIYVDSYGGNGNLFGKIVLGRGIEAKAERMYVDGRPLRCGKWGSSAAQALDKTVKVDDRIFSGEGILTIPSHATIIRIR